MALETTNLDQKPVLAVGRSYDFGFLRNLVQGFGQGEGIAPVASIYGTAIPGDLAVTTAGSGLGVSIATGRAFVQGDASIASHLTNAQGHYFAYVSPAQSVTMATADATNPRIDQIVLRVYDSDVDGSGQIKWAVEKVTGTPTAGATLANLNGAAALPSTAMRLAYVLVPAAFAGPFVNATHILDQRNLALPRQACIMTATGLTPTAGTLTQLALGTVGLDNNRMADTTNNRINIRVAGIYAIHGYTATSAAGTAGANRIAYLYKNGSLLVADTRDSVGSGNTDNMNVQAIAYLAVGDYIDLRATHYTDSATVAASLEVVRIG